AQVVLNDEDQKIATAGLVASGNIDPLTRGFACSWTDRMEDVYNAEPIWRELHNMFRHFALTRILKDCDAFTQAEFDSAFLLDEYDVPNVEVAASLPGLSRLDEIQVQPPGSDRLLKTVVPVCGGVSVGFGHPIETNPPAAATNMSGAAVMA